MGVMNNLKRIKALEAGSGSGGGSGGSGSSVSVEQILKSGTNIANITVDGVKTDLFAPDASGGSEVTVTQLIDEGTHIADITVDGVKTELFAPSGSASSNSETIASAVKSITVNGDDVTSKFTGKQSISADGHLAMFTSGGFYDYSTDYGTRYSFKISIGIDPSIAPKQDITIFGRVSFTDSSNINHIEFIPFSFYTDEDNSFTGNIAFLTQTQVKLLQVSFPATPWFLT